MHAWVKVESGVYAVYLGDTEDDCECQASFEYEDDAEDYCARLNAKYDDSMSLILEGRVLLSTSKNGVVVEEQQLDGELVLKVLLKVIKEALIKEDADDVG